MRIKGKFLLKGYGHRARQIHRLVKCPGYFAVIHFFSWQLLKLLAVLPKMTEHHVSVYEEPSFCKYFRKGCLLERQVEKFSRFMLVAYCMVQDGVVLPRNDRRLPWTVIKINSYADICQFTSQFQTNVSKMLKLTRDFVNQCHHKRI